LKIANTYSVQTYLTALGGAFGLINTLYYVFLYVLRKYQQLVADHEIAREIGDAVWGYGYSDDSDAADSNVSLNN
jgi:hypothetical protein